MEFDYPENCTSDGSRKKFRDRTRRNNPNELFADYSDQENGERIKTDLSFYTPQLPAWRSTFCDEYIYVVKTPINYGERLTICHDTNLDTENPILTISCYTSGTVLVQAYEASLNTFESIFPRLRARVVERERDQTHVNSPDSVENSPPSTSDHQLTEEQQGQTEERAEERDQPQTAAKETNSITNLTKDFSELKSK